MGTSELRRSRSWAVPSPLRLSPRDIVQVPHDPVGRDQIGAGRNEGVVTVQFPQHVRFDKEQTCS